MLNNLKTFSYFSALFFCAGVALCGGCSSIGAIDTIQATFSPGLSTDAAWDLHVSSGSVARLRIVTAPDNMRDLRYDLSTATMQELNKTLRVSKISEMKGLYDSGYSDLPTRVIAFRDASGTKTDMTVKGGELIIKLGERKFTRDAVDSVGRFMEAWAACEELMRQVVASGSDERTETP